MLDRLAVVLALALALGAGGCASAPADAAKTAAGPRPPTAFDSWALGNGTGAFFKAVGPAGGAGIR